MAKSKFTKGQEIFQVARNFASNDRAYFAAANKGILIERKQELRVISRIVDACGQKQVTFVDRGHDSIFGRSHGANAEYLFATAEDAFKFAQTYNIGKNYTRVVHPVVVGDNEPVVSTLE